MTRSLGKGRGLTRQKQLRDGALVFPGSTRKLTVKLCLVSPPNLALTNVDVTGVGGA